MTGLGTPPAYDVTRSSLMPRPGGGNKFLSGGSGAGGPQVGMNPYTGTPVPGAPQPVGAANGAGGPVTMNPATGMVQPSSLTASSVATDPMPGYSQIMDQLIGKYQMGLDDARDLIGGHQDTMNLNYGNLKGYARTDHNLNLADNNISRDMYNALIGLTNERYGLQLQGHDISDKRSWSQAREDRRQARSDATARGAITSQGFRDDKKFIKRMLNLDLKDSQVDRGLDRVSRDQSNTRDQAALSRLGIDDQRSYNQMQKELARYDIEMNSENLQLLGMLQDAMGTFEGGVHSAVSLAPLLASFREQSPEAYESVLKSLGLMPQSTTAPRQHAHGFPT